MPETASLTERQQKWFASVREGLERETGRSLPEWVKLAQACPETSPRKRLTWMKATYGLGQNRAMMVLDAAFQPESGWSTSGSLADSLWADPAARAIHEAARAIILALPDVIVGQRKAFTAYSRRLQFCALRPTKQGAALGLALDPASGDRLRRTTREPWSERLHSVVLITAPDDLPSQTADWLQQAWDRS